MIPATLLAFDLKNNPSLSDPIPTVDKPIKSSLFLITNKSIEFPVNGIEKLLAVILGSSTVATSIFLFATGGTFNVTFWPVTNGWSGRYNCLLDIDICFSVSPM